MKKIYVFVASVCLFVTLLTGISIHANVETGSMTIQLNDTSEYTDKENVHFGMTKVADLIDGEFVSIDGINIDFNKVETAEQMEQVAYYLQNKVEYEIGLVTNEHGIAHIDNLPIGLYLVTTKDIGNYENITPYLVSIPMFNEVTHQMDYDVLVMPKHEPLVDILVNKVDSYTKKNIVSKDFKFAIYSDKNLTQLYQKAEVDTKKGTAMFENLSFGTFYIKEVKAPKGYQLSNEVVEVKIDHSGVYFNGQKVDGKNHLYSYEYQNELLEVIGTGDQSQLLLFSVIALISGVTVFVVYKKKRKV